MENLDILEARLELRFNNLSLLKETLTHDSYINENPSPVAASNERLEFLGDAILGAIIAEKLYRDFPEFAEGKLTRFRSLLVRGATLARLAKSMCLGDFLYLGKGEESTGGRQKPANLASVLEALVAAIYLDQGMDASKNFVLKLFENEIEGIIKSKIAIDYKSRLMHFTQAQYQETPGYRIVAASGPDHARHFTAEALLGQKVLGEGSGSSKKEAETAAARAALEALASLHGDTSLLD